MEPAAREFFRIDELTGEIFPLAVFNRETKDNYIFDVEARDSAPSSLPGTDGPNRGRQRVGIRAPLV